jgi:hypothetical protein
MPLAVEPNHATVVIAAPVLRVDPYQHPSRSHSIYPVLRIVVQMLVSSSTSCILACLFCKGCKNNLT